MVSVVIHTNPHLENQKECAGWLFEGFKRFGIQADITADKQKAADVHIVQGPHYCFDYWRERSGTHRVLWLNRCLWGHPRLVISLGWLRPDGSRDFRNGGAVVGKGTLPALKQRKESAGRAIIFGDYGLDHTEQVMAAQKEFSEVAFRPHPQGNPELGVDVPVMGKPRYGLDDCLSWADTALGHSSTVLVDALIYGLTVRSSDRLHVVNDCDDRETWIKRYSWANWNYQELEQGAFWEHLNDSQ